jgi:nucleotide-binding universal stress UspA family protein
MSFLVPFDGSTLAEAALVRAVEYADALGEGIVVVSIVPERTRYAREKGWVEEGEPYDPERVVDRLEARVSDLAPDARFESERIGEYPPPGTIAGEIARIGHRHDPSVVFLGSENVGSVVTPLASVGTRVAADETYDLHIVRHPAPPALDGVDPHPTYYDR